MNINMCVGEGTGARDRGAGRQGVGGKGKGQVLETVVQDLGVGRKGSGEVWRLGCRTSGAKVLEMGNLFINTPKTLLT